MEKSGRVKENTERLRVLLSGDLDLFCHRLEDVRSLAGQLSDIGSACGASITMRADPSPSTYPFRRRSKGQLIAGPEMPASSPPK